MDFEVKDKLGGDYPPGQYHKNMTMGKRRYSFFRSFGTSQKAAEKQQRVKFSRNAQIKISGSLL